MSTSKGGLTPGDLDMLATVLKHATTEPQVDWDAICEERGFKSPNVAKTRYSQVKKKIKGSNGSANSPAGGIDKLSPTKVSTKARSATKAKKRNTKDQTEEVEKAEDAKLGETAEGSGPEESRKVVIKDEE